MPRRHDPINDFFNELLDATVTTLIDTMRPEFRKLAKSAVEQAKLKADAKANTTKGTGTTKKRSNVERRVTPSQLTLYDVLEVSPPCLPRNHRGRLQVISPPPSPGRRG